MTSAHGWIRFNYVCATCWSPLTTINGKPACTRHPVDHEYAGYHLAESVTKSRARSERDYHEVVRLYADTPFAFDLGLRTRLTPAEMKVGKEALKRSEWLF